MKETWPRSSQWTWKEAGGQGAQGGAGPGPSGGRSAQGRPPTATAPRRRAWRSGCAPGRPAGVTRTGGGAEPRERTRRDTTLGGGTPRTPTGRTAQKAGGAPGGGRGPAPEAEAPGHERRWSPAPSRGADERGPPTWLRRLHRTRDPREGSRRPRPQADRHGACAGKAPPTSRPRPFRGAHAAEGRGRGRWAGPESRG